MPNFNFRISVVALALSLSTTAFAVVNEADFRDALKKIETTYKDDVAKLGLNLVVDGEYENDTQNAYTSRLGKTQLIKVYGGVAKAATISADDISFIACHELGHTLGGNPNTSVGNNTYYSNEGQSDYFASVKCFKRINRSEDNESIVSGLKVPFTIKAACNEQFKDDANEAALCIRTSMAGLETATWIAVIGKVAPLSIERKDPTIASSTNLSFPSTQCRLDTFLAGALCKSKTFGDDPTKLNDGYCANNEIGARPLCWFKP